MSCPSDGSPADVPPETIPRIPLTALSEAQRQKALVRFELLRPFLEDGVPLARIAVMSGCSIRTLWSWVARLEELGLAGLVHQPRSDRGTFRMPEKLRQVIQALALQNPAPSAASVYRKVQSIAPKNGWTMPSYAVVWAIIHQLPPALTTLAHEGTKAYEEAFDLLYRREATASNEIWQADHTPLDIRILDEAGEAVRPWLTAIIDDYSRAVPGWRVSLKAPSALQTSLTLRQAIWRKSDPRWTVCGIPSVLYTDHGSDFTSQHLRQVGVELKFRPVFSTQGRPCGRGRIERFFATINQTFLSEQPGYLPPDKPPDQPPAKPVLTLGQLEDRLSEFMLNDYLQREHSQTGQPPQARWEAGGFLPRMPESLDKLDLLLLTVARSRLVRRDGIYFQTLRYLDPLLAAYVGETVTIRYDPRDMTEIRVFHEDRFLCRAVSQELSGQQVSLADIIRARKTRRRELRTRLKTHREVVEALLEAHKTDMERLPEPPSSPPPVEPTTSRLKRYWDDDLSDD
jgi:putative transposase